MRRRIVASVALILASAIVHAQEIVEVPASKANVARPDDLFSLPPGQWHRAKLLAVAAEPCTPDQCEAGFTSGDLVISVGCEQTAYSEVEVGSKPGKPTFGRVASQVNRVVKGLGKTCKLPVPEVPKLEVAALFSR